MVRQRESFNILMQQWDRVKELTEESANAAGTADEKYEAYMDSMEAATKRLQNAWESLSQSFEASPLIKGVTNLAAGLTENTLGGVGWLKQLIPMLLVAKSGSIISSITNPGETGGFKGLLKNIPIIGDVFKRNDNIANIAKDVAAIRKTEEKESLGLGMGTKNGGAVKKMFYALTGRQDIVDPETGESVSYDDLKFAKKWGLANSEGYTKYAKLLTQRRIGNAAFGAGSAALTQLLTTKKVGAGQGGILDQIFGINKAIAGGSEQTIEETAGDKIGRIAASTILAGAGGAIAGPLGAMLGQTLGEGFAGMFSTWFHRDELEMKQRVQDAKENLERLDSLNSLIEENSSIMTEEMSNAEDFEKLYKYTDALYDKLFELQYEGNVNIVDAINDAGTTLYGEDNQSISNIQDIVQRINDGNTEQRQMIKKQLSLAESMQRLAELRASQEETKKQIEDAMGSSAKLTGSGEIFTGSSKRYGAQISNFANAKLSQNVISDLNKYADVGYKTQYIVGAGVRNQYITDITAKGETLREKVENAQKLYQILSKQSDLNSATLEQVKEYVNELNKAYDAQKKINSERIKQEANVGILSADIQDLTSVELTELTMDGVVGRVVKAMEEMGYKVRDAAGYIKEDYQSEIEQLIKSDSKFNVLQQTSTKTLGQLTRAEERFVEMLADNSELVDEYGKSWEKWYDAAKRGELSEEIAKIVYAANPERIEQFARAWNTTRNNLEQLIKETPNITTAIGLMSPSEVREYYSVFSDFFDDLADDSTLTVENFEKLLTQYPQLLKYYKQGTLKTELIKGITKEQQVAYVNSILSAEMSSSGVSEGFLQAIIDYSTGTSNIETDRLTSLTEGNVEAVKKALGSVKSLNEALSIAIDLKNSNNKEDQETGKIIEELVGQYMDYEREIEWMDPEYEKAKQATIDNLQEQIDNLNEQKEALSKINDERKKEIELIKARDALENAKKEKKRVYRQGIIMPLSNYIGQNPEVDKTEVR